MLAQCDTFISISTGNTESFIHPPHNPPDNILAFMEVWPQVYQHFIFAFLSALKSWKSLIYSRVNLDQAATFHVNLLIYLDSTLVHCRMQELSGCSMSNLKYCCHKKVLNPPTRLVLIQIKKKIIITKTNHNVSSLDIHTSALNLSLYMSSLVGLHYLLTYT